ncbi:MAG TPA: hypothetical protein VHX88_02955 [Solirubrobacteraceae bacterium]|jgi:hypothetical protein|nr:hypothetical protein [Solirubrobacteraceae bacterium]
MPSVSHADPAETARAEARERLQATQLLISKGVRVSQVYRVYEGPGGSEVASEILYSTPDGAAETAEVRADGDIVTHAGW